MDLAATRARVAARLVGRDREIDLVLAAVAAGRDLVLEGPPGTSKTTLLQAITQEWGIGLLLVEGNADLTPAKLVGHHDPARVLREDYTVANFVEGPLVTAMRTGGFLYLEELNRAPEDALNVLLTAMADREIAVPRFGTVRAAASFRVIGSMNPLDDVGTNRLSGGLLDRFCRLSLDYQDEPAERAVVALRAQHGGLSESLGARLIADAVALTRATRQHVDIRQGSSVRGAIDAVLIGAQLANMRGVESADDRAYPALVLDAALLALSARVHLDDAGDRTVEAVLTEIWEDHFILHPAIAEPG
jgi:MoxR-like ATPase